MIIERKDGKIFCPLIKKYLVETPEEKVRQEYIIQLIEYYGYLPEQMAQEVKVNTRMAKFLQRDNYHARVVKGYYIKKVSVK